MIYKYTHDNVRKQLCVCVCVLELVHSHAISTKMSVDQHRCLETSLLWSAHPAPFHSARRMWALLAGRCASVMIFFLKAGSHYFCGHRR